MVREAGCRPVMADRSCPDHADEVSKNLSGIGTYEAVHYRNRRAHTDKGRWAAATAACVTLAVCCVIFVVAGGKNGPMTDELLSKARKQVLDDTTPTKAQIANWGYSGDARSENWATLNAEYMVCQGGKEQSPIDVQRTKVKGHVNMPALRWEGLENRSTAKTVAAKEFWDMGQVRNALLLLSNLAIINLFRHVILSLLKKRGSAYLAEIDQAPAHPCSIFRA